MAEEFPTEYKEAKWYIIPQTGNEPNVKEKKGGIYYKTGAYNKKKLVSEIVVDKLASDWSFIGLTSISNNDPFVRDTPIALALPATKTDKVFDANPLFHSKRDAFPGVFEYNGRLFISGHDFAVKAKKGSYTPPWGSLPISYDLSCYHRKLKADKWYLKNAAPFFIEKKPMYLVFDMPDGLDPNEANFTVYEIKFFIGPNVVGPNDLFRTGYSYKPTGNSMTCALLGENTDKKQDIPVFPNVDHHKVENADCNGLPIMWKNDCNCGTAYDEFYNGRDTGWFENLYLGKLAISQVNWNNYCNDKYRASFIDGWIPLNGKRPVDVPVDSQNNVVIKLDADSGAVLRVAGLYYCPLTVMGYPVDLGSPQTKWVDTASLTRDVYVNFSEPFFSNTDDNNKNPRLGKLWKPFPTVNETPSALQMYPNFAWHKPTHIKKCKGGVVTSYERFRKQFLDPFATTDKEQYDLLVQKNGVLSQEQWALDIEHKLSIPGFGENVLWVSEAKLFYEYYCNECVAWLWFARHFPASWDASKVKPRCATTFQTATVNKWVFVDIDVLLGIAAIEAGVAFALRKDPMVVFIVPTSAVLMFGLSLVWANRSDRLHDALDSFDDLWFSILHLFDDAKAIGKAGEKTAKRAEEGIAVAVVGICTTGTVMMLTYRELGAAGAELLATEFMIGVVGTLAVEAYIAIAKDVSNFWDDLFGWLSPKKK